MPIFLDCLSPSRPFKNTRSSVSGLVHFPLGSHSRIASGIWLNYSSTFKPSIFAVSYGYASPLRDRRWRMHCSIWPATMLRLVFSELGISLFSIHAQVLHLPLHTASDASCWPSLPHASTPPGGLLGGHCSMQCPRYKEPGLSQLEGWYVSNFQPDPIDLGRSPQHHGEYVGRVFPSCLLCSQHIRVDGHGTGLGTCASVHEPTSI
jgi:hypothetical protein